ncbi:MAG: hypothetical protein HC769_20895 [Cyanobacteria bacterium CRU_2_1]|nr:hypothetical protein [Cyanobacteria bacterium RU_5_0]NJR61066.1 hypothetical protein [Cyanobacteria bacterium CRU_2_1]
MKKKRQERQTRVTPIDTQAWKTIAASFLVAAFLLTSRPLILLFNPFLTVVHELGHTILAWLFGYFAIPAFDFIYGGGVTIQTQQPILLIAIGIYTGFAYLFYRYRKNALTCKVLLGILILYAICAYTPLHHSLMIAMGHGSELIVGGIFLYRALSGSGCCHMIERPIYGMLGFFAVLYDTRFAYRILTIPQVRSVYEEGKGGVLHHDLVRLAGEYWGVELSIVMIGFLLLSLLTPVIPFLLFRYQVVVKEWRDRLLLKTRG